MESILNRKNLLLGQQILSLIVESPPHPPKKGTKNKDEELLPLKVYSLTGSIQLNMVTKVISQYCYL